MREILFRGKIDNLSPDTGKWVHGPYVPESSGGYIYNTMYRPHMVRVDPTTVGQYTGLMDKNGKRIFEGDVVTIPGSNKCGLPAQIHYYQRRGAFVIARIGYNPICLEDAEEWCEVIGNIHDNPELLKGGADHEH